MEKSPRTGEPCLRQDRRGTLGTRFWPAGTNPKGSRVNYSNLAEGYERTHKAEKIQFYKIAKASAAEVRSLSYVLKDRKRVRSIKLKKRGILPTKSVH